MDNERVKAHFDSQAPNYHDLWFGPMRSYREWEAAALFDMLGSCRGREVLDLGCGSGFYTRRALARGATGVTAVDFSPGMVSQLDQSGITALCGDAATIELGHPFPLILCAGMLEFVPDPQAVIANAARHLSPGGRLALLVPQRSLGGSLYRLYHRMHGLTIRVYSPKEIEAFGRACGLRVIDRRSVWPLTLVVRLEKPPTG